MDIRSVQAARQYAETSQAIAPKAQAQNGPDVAAMARDFAATLKAGEETALSAMAGRADPQSLVVALAQADLAVQTAVTVRDKVVEAYQEILRMPV